LLPILRPKLRLGAAFTLYSLFLAAILALVSFSDFLAGFYPKNHIGKLFSHAGRFPPFFFANCRDFETGQNWFLQVALECHWLLPNYSLIVWGKS